MGIFVVGTSHRTAGALARERMHVPLEDVFELMGDLCSREDILSEAVPLHTCGRLELYGVGEPNRAIRLLGRLIERTTGVPRAELERDAYVHRDGAAVRHLFAVASGLDSAIQGEAQILGQVREAAHDPRVRASMGPVLHRLFQHALRTGKRVRAATEIGRGAASLASAAVEMLRNEVDDLRSKSVLVVGAGDTGALMARLLAKAGVARLTIANRTRTVAERVAGETDAETLDLGHVGPALGRFDVVVGAVTVSQPVVTTKAVEGLAEETRPALFLDLAHPRCFEVGLEDLPGIVLIDLAQVFGRVTAAREARSAHLPRAWEVVEEEAVSFETWHRSRDSTAVVRAVRQRALSRAIMEANRHARSAPEDERERMRLLARSVARAILHQPTMALRDVDPSSDHGRAFLEHASALFGVDLPADGGEPA